MAEKTRPEDDPQGLIDEVTERVFINYEPPRADDSGGDEDEDETDREESHPAA
jgi:hypothetical protein